MNIKLLIKTLLFLFIFTYTIPAYAQGNSFSKAQTKLAESAIKSAEQGNWAKAENYAKQSGSALISKLISWMRHKEGAADNFLEISEFVGQNPHWPDLVTLRHHAENAINGRIPYITIVEWFEHFPPLTRDGIKSLLKAKSTLLQDPNAIKQDKEIKELVKQLWINYTHSASEEATLLKDYPSFLTQDDHIKRINSLIWQDKISEAKRMLPMVSADYQKLFKARIKIKSSPTNIDTIVSTVPKKLSNDHGLIYDILCWHHDNNNYEHISLLLKKVSGSHLNQDKWWQKKARHLRDILEERKYQEAYNIAKNHNGKNSIENVDSEWLAGWLSLRFLDDPKAAGKHFLNFYNQVKTPMSIARGAYWAGRAHEEAGDQEIAKEWYKIAAHYPYIFYGQLALIKLGHKHITIPNDPKYSKDDQTRYQKNELAKLASFFAQINRIELAKTFAKSAILNAKTAGEVALIINSIIKTNNAHLITEIGKFAIREKMVFTSAAYPTLRKFNKLEIEYPLALAVIRQESVFNQYAESNAGAHGFMQLLPETARDLSKELRIKYSKPKLKSDYLYNVTLGSYYLKKLLDKYNGSYLLTLAAYNAGPHRADKWIGIYGDPRTLNNTEDLVDWIETIPFPETRNYVQRIMENIILYRVLTAKPGSKVPLTLFADLKGNNQL